ncbi:MAG TPA: histidine kinase N-terminal 7TM domain-containing protein [Methanofastidiosum sp.]|nr:histidine kinase N-terminal 7TM domain-containing protein [Methanofastidiosum sp.]
MQFTLYQIPLLVSSLFSAIIIALLYRRKKAVGRKFLILFLSSIFIWSVADFFNLLNTTLNAKIFWSNFSYFGVATFSIFLILFVLEYIGKGELINRSKIILLSIIPIITIILIWTNEHHHLMRQSFFIQNISGLLALGKVYGTWFWIQFIYAHSIVIISSVLIFYSLSLSLNIYKKQGIIFLIGILGPLISNLLYVSRIVSFPIDMTSVSFAITGMVLYWGITRENLLDFVPTVYMEVFNEIPDGVLILDSVNQVVGMNPSAESIFNIKFSDIRRMNLQELINWNEFNKFINEHRYSENYHGSFSHNNKYYDVNLKTIYDKKHSSIGKLIVLHDISKRREMEEQLINSNKQIEGLNDTLQIIHKILRHDLLNKFTIMKFTFEIYKESGDKLILDKLENSIDNGVELINRLRELESFIIAKGDLIHIPVRDIVERVSTTITVPIEIKGNANVIADDALFSVFENIMRNSVVHGKTDRIKVDIKSKNKISTIKVTDFGKGILEDIKDKIFEEGISYGENKGSGLGLFIVKKTIERYGGEIKVEDNKPSGAIFIIKLKSA